MDTTVNNTMEALRFENLFADSPLLSRVKSLTDSALVVKHRDGQQTSLDDLYFTLENEVSSLRSLELDSEISSTGTSKYINRLVTNLHALNDDMSRVELRLMNMLVRLRDVEADFSALQAEFEAWYTLAASEYLQAHKVKLPTKVLPGIARAEFSRATGQMNVNITSLIEAVKVLQKQLSSKQKMAREKFSYGQRQADAAWADNLPPARGVSEEDLPDEGLSEPAMDEDEDEIPRFVSKFTKQEIAPEEDSEEEPMAFVKYGVPVPVTVIEPVSDAPPVQPEAEEESEDEDAEPVTFKPRSLGKVFDFEDD